MNLNMILSVVMLVLPYELKREEWKVNEFIKTVTPDIVTLTTYKAVVGETDSTPLVTATGFKINPNNARRHRIIAVSRDLKRKWGMNSKVRIVGAGKYDGTYYVRDLMNSRYRKRIDILISDKDKQTKLKKIKVYKL